LDILDAAAVCRFAQEQAVGLVVIGPEAPLVGGVADIVRAAGIAVFGPGAAGARLEGSKHFAKDLMCKYDIPTAAYAVFTSEELALDYLEDHPAPIVIKANGLAAGKGVTVAQSDEEARCAVRECFAGRFGQAGAKVVIEENLVGPECSLLAFVDGQTMMPMVPAQDHKRALAGDRGPNTGGMGVYSPVPIVSRAEHDAMIKLMEQTVAALQSEGIDYRGVLYGGFILTDQGPRVLEFNARFGDPETQVVLPLLQSDLLEVMLAVGNGDLKQDVLRWSDQWAISVVLASAGYPGTYQTGQPISGIEAAEALPNVTVFHAGTRRDSGGRLLTDGGRVLNVTALANSFEEARAQAYRAVDLIDFPGKQYRLDIGQRALGGRVAWNQNTTGDQGEAKQGEANGAQSRHSNFQFDDLVPATL
jgi:phosphoribosylamine--glycine ligase